VAGRLIEERDRDLNSIVVSEGVVKTLWGNDDPLGGRLGALGTEFRVVGVIKDSRSTSLKAGPTPMIYVHYNYRTPGQTFFVARGAYGTEGLAERMREVIREQAPNVTVSRVKPLDAQVRDSLGRERFQTLVLNGFGAAALLLAMLGIYGILSYSVESRKQEIGVRMALGATRGRVYRLTMAEASRPVVAGLLAGLAASLMARRVIEKFLYGVQAVDPAVIAGVAGLFLSAAVLAAFVPARRAASIDPMEALRPE
jgi:ABC-type antimicrobial peptide transport system permease subunit